MARNSRQSKILELISTKEIETQEELVAELKAANFEITQATISRDIKELGLIKIATENNKYKYAVMGASTSPVASSKKLSIFKECVVSVKTALNLVVVKTMNGTAGLVCPKSMIYVSGPSANVLMGRYTSCIPIGSTVIGISCSVGEGVIVALTKFFPPPGSIQWESCKRASKVSPSKMLTSVMAS